jgi:hypothetical protein
MGSHYPFIHLGGVFWAVFRKTTLMQNVLLALRGTAK